MKTFKNTIVVVRVIFAVVICFKDYKDPLPLQKLIKL